MSRRFWKPRRRFRRTAQALLLSAAMLPPGARAQDAPVPVDLELVLAVDVSGSIDPEEARLQREGYFAALTDSDVIAAIRSGLLQRIAVTYVEWAGAGYQRTVIDWTVIGSDADAHAFAARIAAAPALTESLTSISGVIDRSAEHTSALQ